MLEANGSLVSKEQLLARVWPGIVVAQDNLKMHVFALRRALGEDRDYVRTELAAVTGSLRQSARRLLGADVSAHCDGATRQLRSCILDEPIGDSGMVGRSKLSIDLMLGRQHKRETD